MRNRLSLLAAALLLHGCGEGQRQEQNTNEVLSGRPPATAQGSSGAAWDLQSSGEGTALALASADGTPMVRIFCPAGAKQLVVNLPSFRPIGSEERMSFGSGGEAHALVADSRGDAQRGGVTGTGPVPANLGQLIAGAVSVSYGAQSSGPHPAPPNDLAAAFAGACAVQKGEPAPPKPTPAGACLTQDGKPVPANRLRAIGTEPFWGARIEGRCITYSHPEDQSGTRVWTRFSGTAAGGSWSGSLRGSPFLLKTRPQAGCSDGMSDNRYPIAVTLTVGGEQRTGCAQPL
ncbi:MAG: hypothetical protein H0V46_03760 [Sphingomonas sp.]|nr:hypothetical protein [Sphingomonas sp.]